MEAERMRTVSKLWAADIPAAMYTGKQGFLFSKTIQTKAIFKIGIFFFLKKNTQNNNCFQ